MTLSTRYRYRTRPE